MYSKYTTPSSLSSHRAHRHLHLVVTASWWYSPCVLHCCHGDGGGHPGSRSSPSTSSSSPSWCRVVVVGLPPLSCPSSCLCPSLSLLPLLLSHRHACPPHCRPPRCHRHVAVALAMDVMSLSLSCQRRQGGGVAVHCPVIVVVPLVVVVVALALLLVVLSLSPSSPSGGGGA